MKFGINSEGQKEARTTNKTYLKGGVSCSEDSFVVNGRLVFQIKFCGKSPALRIAAKRQQALKKEDNRGQTNIKTINWTMAHNNSEQKANEHGATPFAQTYFHGTKAHLKVGDLIEVGFNSNYGERKNAKYIFLTSTLDAAIWGAELAFGDGIERIYLVEPTGEIENDPDLTDQRFPGNPSMSYRSLKPFRVVGEVTVWQGHPTEQVKAMKESIKKLDDQGIKSLND